MPTSSELAIEVEHLSKLYTLGQRRCAQATLAGAIGSWMKAPVTNFRKIQTLGATRDAEPNSLWALRDVSFDVEKGEVVGIIGRNGAGKSTLLKILSRITSPSYGTATILGKVASLLEVGTGFHPELTGRENVYLNGSILGMNKAEIDSKFDEIVEFAGVKKFMDTPVKRYSSGMQVRLAFSVAAHIEPEILIVDEVLAVGDAEFQAKCIGKMRSVTQSGDRTVLFVSHNMTAIKKLCSRCILLDEGKVVMVGSPDAVVREYLSIGGATKRTLTWNPASAPGSDELRFTSVRLLDRNGQPDCALATENDLFLEVRYVLHKDLSNLRITLSLFTDEGIEILASSDYHDYGERRHREPGEYASVCRIPGGLLNVGRYVISVHADVPTVASIVKDVRIPFEIEELSENHMGVSQSGRPPGIIHPNLDWQVTRNGRSHSGALAGRIARLS